MSAVVWLLVMLNTNGGSPVVVREFTVERQCKAAADSGTSGALRMHCVRMEGAQP